MAPARLEQRVTFAYSPDARWQDQAACKGMNSELFFMTDDGQPHPTARAVCEGCPVRLDCLNYAQRTRSVGVWGGTTEEDRNRGRRRAIPADERDRVCAFVAANWERGETIPSIVERLNAEGFRSPRVRAKWNVLDVLDVLRRVEGVR